VPANLRGVWRNFVGERMESFSWSAEFVLSSSEEGSSWGVRSGGSSWMEIPNGSLLLLP
jgi:hypothetical protein